MAGEDDKALIPSIVKGISATNGQRRIPYNSGYGDFCFVRRCDWLWVVREKHAKAGDDAAASQAANESTIDNPVLEIDSYQGPGFRLFDLPIEVVRLIFGFIVLPFLYYDEKLQKYISFIELGYWKPKVTEEEPPRFRMMHPDRGSYELIFLKPSRFNGYINWKQLEWLRGASNTSAQFRLSLGDALWARSCVLLRNLDSERLGFFLNERPSICRVLKELSIDLCCSVLRDSTLKWGELQRTPCRTYLTVIFELIRENLVLEGLHVELTGAKAWFDELIRGDAGLQLLCAMRSLRVTKRFRITTVFEYDAEEYEEEYAVLLENYLMPMSLRGEEEMKV